MGVCSDSTPAISFTAISFDTPVIAGSNNEIDVLFNNVVVDMGVFSLATTPPNQFTGTEPAAAGTSVTVGAVAVDAWGDGFPGGESATPVVVAVPASCGGTACPATIGFWKNTAKHPFPAAVQSGGLTIGGVLYSAADLLTILSATGSGNAVAILGKQLVGALLNKAAGAKDNAPADAAIADAENLLMMNGLNLLTSNVAPGSTLGKALLVDEVVLDSYNSADFGTCSEGSGLILGPRS
jgi:hypothetical protein